MQSGDLDDERGDAPAPELPGEPYYRGTVIRWSRGSRHGVVRSEATGREIPFELQHVVVLDGDGNLGGIELREGLAVGFDVGWTSRGLRVTKLFPAR
ncbi:MAG: hypothetical protein AB1689_25490 [Thermodesulfobacteriota bacterium]